MNCPAKLLCPPRAIASSASVSVSGAGHMAGPGQHPISSHFLDLIVVRPRDEGETTHKHYWSYVKFDVSALFAQEAAAWGNLRHRCFSVKY